MTKEMENIMARALDFLVFYGSTHAFLSAVRIEEPLAFAARQRMAKSE
jgi:hypothetical protein